MVQKRIFYILFLIICLIISCKTDANKYGYAIKHSSYKSFRTEQCEKYYAYKKDKESGVALYVFYSKHNKVEEIEIACNQQLSPKDVVHLKTHIFPVNNEMQLTIIDDILKSLKKNADISTIHDIRIRSCCLGDADAEFLDLIKRYDNKINESLHYLCFYADLMNVLDKHGISVTKYKIAEIFPTYIKCMEPYCIIQDGKRNEIGANAEIQMSVKYQKTN